MGKDTAKAPSACSPKAERSARTVLLHIGTSTAAAKGSPGAAAGRGCSRRMGRAVAPFSKLHFPALSCRPFPRSSLLAPPKPCKPLADHSSPSPL